MHSIDWILIAVVIVAFVAGYAIFSFSLTKIRALKKSKTVSNSLLTHEDPKTTDSSRAADGPGEQLPIDTINEYQQNK
jgi:flagellar basal body-associated protein FliL